MSKNKGFSITSAERYSLALYELASESNVLSQVEDHSSSILNLISSSKDFSDLIKDPTNSQEDLLKERVVGLVKKDDVSMDNLSKMIQSIVKS